MSSGPLTVAGESLGPANGGAPSAKRRGIFVRPGQPGRRAPGKGGRAANSAALEDRSEGDGRRAVPGYDHSPAGEEITFRTLASTMDFTANYLVEGDRATAVGLTAVGFVLGPFVYLGHEMAWEKFGAPRHAATMAVAATSVAWAGSGPRAAIARGGAPGQARLSRGGARRTRRGHGERRRAGSGQDGGSGTDQAGPVPINVTRL
jgi:uncharacterized membrane protein